MQIAEYKRNKPNFRKCAAHGCEVVLRLKRGRPSAYCVKHRKEVNEIGNRWGLAAKWRKRKCVICGIPFRTKNGHQIACKKKSCKQGLNNHWRRMDRKEGRGSYLFDVAEWLMAWEDFGHEPDESVNLHTLAQMPLPQFERVVDRILSGQLRAYR